MFVDVLLLMSLRSPAETTADTQKHPGGRCVCVAVGCTHTEHKHWPYKVIKSFSLMLESHVVFVSRKIFHSILNLGNKMTLNPLEVEVSF